MNRTEDSHHENGERSAWWPAKWMFLVVAMAITLGADPSRDRENWGMLSVLFTNVPVVILLVRELRRLAIEPRRRPGQILAAIAEVACVVAGIRYLWR